ncbi:MAG: bifunctional nuclease family protein [candidate division Zixibacteria bacterium]|nr:bifunctional nuclease family protein [candidate division Zixibacteria bacterium]
MEFLKVAVDGLAMDMTTNSPVVILSPEGINKVLPIWIGHAEAWGIAMELSGVKPRRPMTYDLLANIISTIEARVDRVEITSLQEQTFYARLHLVCGDRKYEIDARPSDSIAIALKLGASIFVNEELFHIEPDGSAEVPPMPTDPESLRERLKKINPEDFGKYTL